MAFFFIVVSYCTFGQGYIKHKVDYGESLSLISYVYHISVNDIKEFNGLTSNVIYVGEIINIPIIVDDSVYYNDDVFVERDCIRKTYISQVGVRELTGHNDGKMVEKFLSSAGLSKGYPWCASFVYWTFKQCGDTLNIKHPAWVPSYFPKEKLIYERGNINKRRPSHGDLIGIWFSSKKRLAHIGFYDTETDKYYITVEGNTNEAGSREGDGVYKKKRIKRQVHSISSWIDE